MRGLRGDVILALHAADELVDQLVETAIGGHLIDFLLHALVEGVTLFEGAAQGLAQIVHGLIEVLKFSVGILEAGVEQIVGERLEQVVHADLASQIAGEFCVANGLQTTTPRLKSSW